jgi:hypothetical protein
VRSEGTSRGAKRLRRRGRSARRAVEEARGAAQLAAAAQALVSAEDRLDQAEKRLADRDALVYAVETIEAAALDAQQLRQQADHQARTLRLEAEREAAELRLAAEREAAELRAAVAQELEQLRSEVARESRKMRVQAKALAEARRNGAQLHLQVEEHAARVRAEADELMRRATAAARRQSPSRQSVGGPEKRVYAQPPASGRPLDPRARRRRARVGVLVASVLSVGGAGLVAAAERPELADAPLVLRETVGWSPQKLDVTTLQRRIAPAADRQGPSGQALAGALGQLDQLTDAQRRNRALGLATDVETAVRNGLLDPEAERLVRPVLLREITPPDVRGLVAMLEVRPLGAGPAGDEIVAALRDLPARPSGPERARVLQQVRDLADAGRLTSAFRYAADKVLA